MNRKADLFDNVTSIIITVIGLLLIIVAAAKLYSYYSNQEERNAQHLIDSVVGKIEFLKEGQTANLVFAGFVSKKSYGWSLWGWSKGDLDRPDKCYFKSCICICPDIKSNAKPTITSVYNEYNAEIPCQEKGFCRLFDQTEVIVQRNETGYKMYASSRTGETYPSGTVLNKGIFLPQNLIELEINKSKDSVSVRSLAEYDIKTGSYKK